MTEVKVRVDREFLGLEITERMDQQTSNPPVSNNSIQDFTGREGGRTVVSRLSTRIVGCPNPWGGMTNMGSGIGGHLMILMDSLWKYLTTLREEGGRSDFLFKFVHYPPNNNNNNSIFLFSWQIKVPLWCYW